MGDSPSLALRRVDWRPSFTFVTAGKCEIRDARFDLQNSTFEISAPCGSDKRPSFASAADSGLKDSPALYRSGRQPHAGRASGISTSAYATVDEAGLMSLEYF